MILLLWEMTAIWNDTNIQFYLILHIKEDMNIEKSHTRYLLVKKNIALANWSSEQVENREHFNTIDGNGQINNTVYTEIFRIPLKLKLVEASQDIIHSFCLQSLSRYNFKIRGSRYIYMLVIPKFQIYLHRNSALNFRYSIHLLTYIFTWMYDR